MGEKILITERCIVESLKFEDYDEVRLLYLDKKVREFLGGVVSAERYKDVFREMISSNEEALYWVARLKNNNFIGLVSIDMHHNGIDKELSYQFLPKYWGNGYAFEVISEVLDFVANELNIDRVVAETQVENKLSCRLLNKLGMKVVEKVYRFDEEQYIFALRL